MFALHGALKQQPKDLDNEGKDPYSVRKEDHHMSENSCPSPNQLPHIQDFIFLRELSEVYLLLDHVSGRWDKSLIGAEAERPIDSVLGDGWLERICEIGWPPTGSEVKQAQQAAVLLRAKDQLNSAAKPANGATIAFTLLVSGEDNPDPVASAPTSWFHRLVRRMGLERDVASDSEAGSRVDRDGNRQLPPGGGGDESPRRPWGNDAPSRISLARSAYPGLVPIAHKFTRRIRLIIFLLLLWLIFTCTLSWVVTAGHSIFGRFDTVQSQRTQLLSRLATAEADALKRTSPAAVKAVASDPNLGKTLLMQCNWSRAANARTAVQDPKSDPFTNSEETLLCIDLSENNLNYEATRVDLANWLATWLWLKRTSQYFCGGRCLSVSAGPVALQEDAINEQWGAILLDVLSSAVLPLCYGFLGAGAAVVRALWSKMKDSLLSPRDLTLALGQLALGAVIGACIGLFVTPSGNTLQPPSGVTGTVVLTASALSFIAGFGVEGVFVALESLIKRVFNVPDATKKP